MSLIGTISHVTEQLARVQAAHAAYVKAVGDQAATVATQQQQSRQEGPVATVKPKDGKP